MSINTGTPHATGYGSVVLSLTGRNAFAASRTARRQPAPASYDEKHGPRTDWLRQLYEHMPDAVFFMADDNRISACNRAAVALFGYHEDELLGRKIDFVWSATPDAQLNGRWADQGAIRAGLAMTKSGAQFPTALTIVREECESETFAAAIFEDFRSERETLLQVQELQYELARLARIVTLGEMTATLAHELSQPLASITAYSEGCARLITNGRQWPPEALRGALSEITQHASWAGMIVQNIREFAKRGTAEKRPESIHALIQEAATLAFAGSQRKDHHVDLQLEAKRDIVVADRVQIIQVLTNLLRNAIEATDAIEQPAIAIHTGSDDFAHLVIDVSDNGCGIAIDIEEALFRPFVTSKPRGLGMGLALSKRIIEAHGGRISARKGMRDGSILSFSLPLVESTINGERSYDPSRG
ncbi:sensor histidine kinase [Rhizobium sp. GCM10022189]|uniref:sensor histidine kinase n=1 Tax=Rhizobium sp. GCM10022189 TaxID=3252654 RepID=UPI00361E99E8